MMRAQTVKRARVRTNTLLGLCVLLSACGNAPQRPTPVTPAPHPSAPVAQDAPSTTLGVPLPVAPTVTFALPTGEVAADAPLVLAFSEPMVPLGALELPVALTGVTTEPAVPVHWRWVSTDTAVGQPQPGWPHAQDVQVHLAAGLQTRAGRTLGQALNWSFATAPPHLVWTSPAAQARFVARNAKVYLLFNQPVDLAVLRQHLIVTGADGDPPLPLLQLAVQDAKALVAQLPAEWPASGIADGQLVALTFAAPLPPWRQVQIDVTPGLPGIEGKRVSQSMDSLAFGTAGGRQDAAGSPLEPFALLQITENTNPDPDQWRAAALHFSAELAPIDQTKALKAVPAVKNLRLQCYDQTCSILGDFAAATAYTLTIAPTLEDAHGRRLDKPVAFKRAFGHRTPELAIDTDGSVMELQQKPHAVAVTLRNLNTLTARAFRVPLDVPWSVLRALKVDDPGYAAALAALGPPVELAVTASRKPDVLERRVLDLDAVLAGQPGHVWLEVATPDIARQPGQRWQPQGREGRLFQVTDLHIAAKAARNETLLWVTSLQSGQPVAGARVELRDENDSVVWRSTTNGEGLVTGPGGMTSEQQKKATERRVTAAKGEDAARLELLAPTPWAQEQTDQADDSERGWLFTDKPVYRPGEAVQIKGLLRLVGKDALGLPAAGREATLQLLDPAGHAAAETQVRLSARGTFASALTLPLNGRLGSWEVHAKSHNAEFGKSVQLAVYHVPRARLELTLGARHVARGDAVRGEVQASWFSGGPLDKAPTHMTASGSAEPFEPPGWPQFQFGVNTWQEDDGPGARNVLNHALRGATDPHGRWTFHVPTGVAMDRSIRVEVAASVQDPNARDMAATQVFWLHPADALVGVGLPSALVPAQAPLPVHLVATDPQGRAQAGLPLALKLLRREWKAIRLRGMGGETNWQTRLVTTPAGTCAATSAALPVDCTLTVQQAGLYTLQATVRDRRARAATTLVDFYATGPDMAWGPQDEQQQLVADKKSYKVGETAHILVRNQVPGALALVTEERAGILRTRLVRLDSAAPTLAVPIEARHAPNVHIGVLAIAGRRSDGALGLDTGAPSVQLESIELAVDPGDHRLAVTVKPEHAKVLPGQKTTVEVTVRDAAGRPRAAEVTLWAVDEGVLALTGEATPDPMATLYAAIARGVEDKMLMEALVRRRAGEEKGDPGGGGGSDRGLTRANLRDVAFWQASLELPADGKVRHTFALPDNLTRWRIMAVAVDGPGDFGSGDADVEASKPLMVQPALPKSVAEGDRVELAATVRNRQAFAVSAHVELLLTGPLALDGAATATLTLAPEQSQEVRFLAVAQGPGQAKVQWRATATAAHQPDAADAVEEPLEVKSLRPLETVASWAQVTGNRLDMLHKDGAVVPDRGGLRIAVSGSLAVGAEVAMAALTDYPYECTEQLASRLQGLLALDALRGADKTALAGVAGDPKVLAQKWLDRIAGRAQFEGGLSLWDAGDANADATLWALWVLADAKAAGLTVDAALLHNAAHWLRSHQPKRQQVQVLAVEAAVGLADPATAEAFFAARAQLPLDDQLWLAAAFARLDVRKFAPQIHALLEPLLAQARVDGESSWLPDAPSAWNWASQLQRQALLVEVLARTEPAHPLLARLTRWLARQQGGHGWRSTQENAWALRALVAVTQAGPAPDGDFKVLVGGQVKLAGPVSRSLHVDVVEIPQGALAQADTPLQLERRGQGPLWLSLAYSYALQTPPQEARNAGLLVRRRLFTLNGEPVTGTLRRGDQVIVQVEVTAGDAWQDVAVVDRPAAGLEPVDLQFANHDAGLARRLAALQVDPRARIASPQFTELAGREVRFFADLAPGTQVFRYVARAANRGSFQDPGARAEAMYRPDVFGTSGAGTLRID